MIKTIYKEDIILDKSLWQTIFGAYVDFCTDENCDRAAFFVNNRLYTATFSESEILVYGHSCIMDETEIKGIFEYDTLDPQELGIVYTETKGHVMYFSLYAEVDTDAIVKDVISHADFSEEVLRHQVLKCMNEKRPYEGDQIDIITTYLDDMVRDWNENDLDEIIDLLLA